MTKHSRYSPRKRLGSTALSDRRISTGWGLDCACPPVGASSPPSSVPRVKLTGSQVDTVRGSAAGVPARSEALPLVPATPCMLRSTSVTRLIAGATGAAGAGSAVGSPGMPAGNCRPAVPGP